jgi:hypothetical protein
VPADPKKPSLSRGQIADPVGTLAAAYGVQRDLGQVVDVAVHRIGGKTGPASPDYIAVGQVLGVIAQDGRNLGRVYRGSPIGPPIPQKSILQMISALPLSRPADVFLDDLLNDMRTALAEAAQPN